MVIKAPKVGVAVEPDMEAGSFYMYLTPNHLKLIQELFTKILEKDTSGMNEDEIKELEEIRRVVQNITNTFNGYSESLFLHNLEDYHGFPRPETEVSLYSHNRELRWGSREGQFQAEQYGEQFIDDVLDCLVKNF